MGLAAIVAALPTLTLSIAARLAPQVPITRAEVTSTVVLDRHGRLLRAFTTSDGRWRLPVEVGDVDPRYIAMLLAFEDRRFHTHSGIDPVSLLRAGVQAVRHRRLVSGGSTLTMQAARLAAEEHGRTLSAKLLQMLRARQLEQRLSKADILRLYLRLAPFGGNIEGVRAASLAYFGKEPQRLSVAEAALLVALPQGPSIRRPDRHHAAARRARDRVLDVAAKAGVITAAEAAEARRDPVPGARRDFLRHAAHVAEREVARHPSRAVHRLTLDRDLQVALERLAHEHIEAAGERLSAAILAADHTTGEIRAYVGSANYLDANRLGAVDMVQAVRSPGSTLKPVIYGLAFEAGLAHPSTLIEDVPSRFGTYAPQNFDDDFRGTVTVREALALSLNIPAVAALAAVGPSRLHNRLRRIGLEPVLPAGAEPTLAIALGGVGLRLKELAELYASLANGGRTTTLTYEHPADRTTVRRPAWRHLLTPVAAWYVTDILKDAPPPASARGGRLAYKTGTSYGHRDAWAIGYDGRHVVAVWVGRADGTSTPGLSGRTAAAPILFDAFARIADRLTPLLAAPAGALHASSATLPPPLRRFDAANSAAAQAPATDTGPFLEPAVRIAFPPDRAEIEAEDAGGEVVLRAEGGALPLTWLIDGRPLPIDPGRREIVWQPSGRGFSRLTVIDARGRMDGVAVRVR